MVAAFTEFEMAPNNNVLDSVWVEMEIESQ